MSPLQAIVLAVVQGLTEFLPVSSSAHLILLPRFLGWPDQGQVFDLATHVGSVVAVLVYFRRELGRLLVASPRLFSRQALRTGSEAAMLFDLGVGTIPAGLAGLLLAGWVATRARDPHLIAATSIGFGLLLALADRLGRGTQDERQVSWPQAVIIGIFQALALVPGTSRSGATITAGRFLGLSRPGAARFSFLLSVPVGLLVTAKEGLDLLHGRGEAVGTLPLVLGFAVSAITSYAVIAWFIAFLQRRSLMVFVVYRVLLGVLILWWFR
ncbi:MAG TPA: undecaprenyl-diphosphate phosphatase [Thermoanaerobaculia bacterium]|nr:undecaprenyl-diphosphate phosphatase [Thermoanaerobaculia bacterium]